MGRTLNMHNKENEIRQYIEQIRELCDKVMECIDSDVECDLDEEVLNMDEEETNGSGETQQFIEIQKNAIESLELKNQTENLDPDNFPYLVRKNTGEKIIVNRNIFKMGKDKTYVDYCISDNPTISRTHADIIKKPNGYYVKDMDSLNHTFLDGVKLEKNEPKKLESGCLIQLANEVFEWHCD
jgi:pSer/pThr/pTyr-binding forkhead associated (FHA) protein